MGRKNQAADGWNCVIGCRGRDKSTRGNKKNSGLPRHPVEIAANFPRHTD